MAKRLKVHPLTDAERAYLRLFRDRIERLGIGMNEAFAGMMLGRGVDLSITDANLLPDDSGYTLAPAKKNGRG